MLSFLIESSMYFRIFDIRGFVALVVISTSCLVLSGCGKKSNTATQIVATVDGEEISIHQINGVLSKSTGVSAENLPTAKREVLERLVDQQVAINEAISKKLDRAPEVVRAIESAKREILARAVLDQIASSQPKPSDDEAKTYYSEHPELFSQRRLFNLQEIALSKATPSISEITSKVAATKSMEEMSDWLKEKNINFSANAGSRAAEQIPLEILPRLHQFKDGQIALVEGKDAFFIMRLVTSRVAPIQEAEALPRIKVFLFNQRGAEAIKREKDLLRSKAKIAYLGEFAGGEAAFKAAAESQVKADTQAADSARAKLSADAEARAKIRADEQAATQAESDARIKARSEAQGQPRGDGKPTDSAVNINLEKGIKGLQ